MARLDAPNHFAKGQLAVSQIKPEAPVGPGVMIDVAARATEDPDFLLQPEHLAAWEEK